MLLILKFLEFLYLRKTSFSAYMTIYRNREKKRAHHPTKRNTQTFSLLQAKQLALNPAVQSRQFNQDLRRNVTTQGTPPQETRSLASLRIWSSTSSHPALEYKAGRDRPAQLPQQSKDLLTRLRHGMYGVSNKVSSGSAATSTAAAEATPPAASTAYGRCHTFKSHFQMRLNVPRQLLAHLRHQAAAHTRH